MHVCILCISTYDITSSIVLSTRSERRRERKNEEGKQEEDEDEADERARLVALQVKYPPTNPSSPHHHTYSYIHVHTQMLLTEGLDRKLHLDRFKRTLERIPTSMAIAMTRASNLLERR